ncbi:MAG: ParB N-terminal domain-containing protein [Polaromonas sp.]
MHPHDPASPGIFAPGTVSTALVGLASSLDKASAPAARLVSQLPSPDKPTGHPGLQPGSGLVVDPALISLSSCAMRSALSFETKAFADLRKDIADTGGNAQPVMVRLLAPAQANGKSRYELVAGHRRLEACRQLNLGVLCLVVGASDAAAAQAMARTNILHVKPAPYEFGCAYVELLADKVYPTQKELAAHLGAGESEVTNAQILARLDSRMIAAFASPLSLRYRDARPLRDAWAQAPEQVLQRIGQVLDHPAGSFTHAQTVDALLGVRPATPEADSSACKILVHVEQTLVATIRVSASGRTVIELAPNGWSVKRLTEMVPGLQALLGDTPLNTGQYKALDIDLDRLEAL